MKRRIKSYLGRLAFAAGFHRTFFAKKALIVQFHRVDDRLVGDPISCSRVEFAEYCDFFARYFRVVTLEALVSRLERGDDIGGLCVITFDDGYEDNFTTAMIELERRNLPACFFIATGLVGSDHTPWWDENLPVRPTWMSWDQVREMQRRGFEIGAHTVNHVDLGVVAGQEANDEIVGSKRRLEEETQRAVDFFSYPYGRIDQLTEDNRVRVEQAGFRCCLSAHGGAVAPTSSPFRLHRMGISPWYLTPYHFGFDLMFLPAR